MHGLQPKQNQYFKESLFKFHNFKDLNKVKKNYTVLITSLLLVQMYNNVSYKKTYIELFSLYTNTKFL